MVNPASNVNAQTNVTPQEVRDNDAKLAQQLGTTVTKIIEFKQQGLTVKQMAERLGKTIGDTGPGGEDHTKPIPSDPIGLSMNQGSGGDISDPLQSIKSSTGLIT